MIKGLTINELNQLTKQCAALGIITLKDLADFIRLYNIEDKTDLLNSINNLFITL